MQWPHVRTLLDIFYTDIPTRSTTTKHTKQNKTHEKEKAQKDMVTNRTCYNRYRKWISTVHDHNHTPIKCKVLTTSTCKQCCLKTFPPLKLSKEIIMKNFLLAGSKLQPAHWSVTFSSASIQSKYSSLSFLYYNSNGNKNTRMKIIQLHGVWIWSTLGQFCQKFRISHI